MTLSVSYLYSSSRYSMWMQCHVNMLVLSVPHQMKTFATYRWRTYSWCQFALIPVVSRKYTTYENMVSVPAKKHNIQDIYHYLSPKWCPHV
jgi:hypothetical protein